MKPKDLDGSKPVERRLEKKEFAKKIGAHLKNVREKTDMSQEELSNKAGYYHTYVNKIEKGKYSPSLHTVWRLAHSLGLSLEEFFKGF